jgi:hypothetical protein
VVTTSVAFPQKAHNAKRDPNVSLLYSYPMGSGLPQPTPVVLVQGLATVEDDLAANARVFADMAERFSEMQKSFAEVWNSRFWRWWHKYYLIRIFLRIQPTRILSWQDGDQSKAPLVLGEGQEGES